MRRSNTPPYSVRRDVKIYLVGGAVRDRLMGVESKDRDYVVVGSTPDEMIASGFKKVGADFPVFLSFSGEEYALARTERKVGSGYHGFETDHSSDVTLEDDLMRRDLTINAMALDLDGKLVDPFNGAGDISNKVLRHVSDAFADDPVRVLRLARFAARYGPDWTIAIETIRMCKSMVEAGELNHLTRERVLMEFEKALAEKHTFEFFSVLDRVGALEVVLPELVETDWCVLGEHDSVKMKFAQLMEYLPGKADAFEEKYVIKSEWRDYRKMFDAWKEPAGDVETLYNMDAFRKPDLFAELMSDIGDQQYLVRAFNVAKAVGFEDLTMHERERLKGPEIGDAIKRLREFRVRELTV